MNLYSTNNHYITILLTKVPPLKGRAGLILEIQNTLLVDPIPASIYLLKFNTIETLEQVVKYVQS